MNSIRSQPFPALTDDDLVGDEIQPGHVLYGVVWINRERMSGTPCFAGTRVPIQGLFDHLEAGDSLDTFLADFPGVTRNQVVALLERSKTVLLKTLVAA